MNPTNSTKNAAEESKFLKPEKLIVGIGAAAVLALVYLLKKSKGIPPDPPPIIIKSGSFDIESDETLTEASGNPNIYKRLNFGEIVGVRVFKTNEVSGAADSDNYEDRNGVEVDIRLQKYTVGSGWSNIDPLVTVRSESNSSGAKDFTLKIGNKLKKKKHPKPGRKERWGDDGTDHIRFGQIIVREDDGDDGIYNAVHGDDYIIAFYNKLV